MSFFSGLDKKIDIKTKYLVAGGIAIIILSGFIRKREIMKFAKSNILYLSYGGKDNYIRHLYNLFNEKKSMLLSMYNKDKIEKIIYDVSKKRGIPYGILYATIKAESSLKPVGTVSWPLDRLIKEGNTAYGMGQVNVPTYIDAVQRYVDYMHEDLWKPEYGIDASALVLLHKYQLAGRDWRRTLELYRGIDYLRKNKPSEVPEAIMDVEKRIAEAKRIDPNLVV